MSEDSRLLTQLDTTTADLPEPLRPLAAAFVHNVRALIATATLPLHFASATIQRERFTRLDLLERMAAQIDVDPSVSKEETRRLAGERAQKRLLGEAADPAGVSALANAAGQFLLETTDEKFSLGAQELLRQSVVLAWGAFEVLARDLLCVYLNEKPDAARELARNQTTAKLFSFRKIDFDAIAAFGFDLSERMGEFVTSANDLSSIEAVRAAFKALVPGAKDLALALADERLWILCKSRHLMVHRRGLVDQKYVDETGSAAAVGTVLEVTPADLKSYMLAVEKTVLSMLHHIAEQLAAPT